LSGSSAGGVIRYRRVVAGVSTLRMISPFPTNLESTRR
jgi:hypothetical protein